MMMRHLRQVMGVWWLTMVGLFCATGLSATTYSVRDLGKLTDLPGRSESRPNAINSSGHVAGANVTNGTYRALLYGGAWTNLGTLGGGEALAAGISDLNRVAGYASTSNGLKHAFLWTPGGTDGVSGNPEMKDLGTLGGNQSEAYDVNNAGQITGYAQTASRDQAFRYSGGAMTNIGALLGGSRPSYGYSINDAGHIAGTAYNSAYTISAAFYYDGITAMEIGSLDGGDSSALAINNANHIVGYASFGEFEHAFHYFDGVMTDLGTLGGNYSYAIGINNSNLIVGGSFIDALDSVYHAFIAVSNSLIDLNTQLDATGAGWTLVEARAVNDAGQIVGVGRFGGAEHAFMLTPVVATPPAPTITSLQIDGTSVLISFTTIAHATYAVEASTNLTAGAWSDVLAGFPGTGSVTTVTNAGALDVPVRFYRIRLSRP